MRHTRTITLAAVLVMAAALLPPLRAQDAKPTVKAEITQISSSATDTQVTLIVTNTAPPSRAALDVPVTVTIGASTYPATLHYPAQDNTYTGPVAFNIPVDYTLLGIQDGGVLTSDATGQHLTFQLTALDASKPFTTTFTASLPLVSGSGGTLVSPGPPGAITASPVTADPTTAPTPETTK